MSKSASTATPEVKQPQSISNTIDGILDRASSKILLAFKDNKELRNRACQYMRQLTETDSDKLYMGAPGHQHGSFHGLRRTRTHVSP